MCAKAAMRAKKRMWRQQKNLLRPLWQLKTQQRLFMANYYSGTKLPDRYKQNGLLTTGRFYFTHFAYDFFQYFFRMFAIG